MRAAKTIEPRKTDAKPETKSEPKAPAKTEALERQPTRKAAPVTSTLSLKKKPSHRVMLADWAP